QHCVQQMPAGDGMAEHMRQEDALVDLEAFLLAQHLPVVASYLLARWRQTGKALGCVVDQLLGANEIPAIICQLAIDAFNMRGEKLLAGRALRLEDEIGGRRLRLVAA